jgi:DNA sulfur modification protein DndD
MIFKTITIENFKSYRGKHTLHFSTDRDKNVTIISGENNHGKSVLLESVKWCLYNENPPPNRMPIANKDLLFENKSFDVIVTLDISHLGEIYRIRRKYQVFDERDIDRPKTELYISGVKLEDGTPKRLGNFETEADFNLFIKSLLPQSVSKYFLVDGDQIDGFTNPTDDKTKSAIEDLLKVNLLRNGLKHIKSLKTELNRELIKICGPGKKNDLDINVFNEIENQIKKTTSKLNKIKEDLSRISNMVYKLDIKTAEVSESALKQKRIINIDDELKRSIGYKNYYLTNLSNELSSSYLVFLRETMQEVWKEIEKNRESGKLPKPYDEILVKDLLNKKVCICGTCFENNSEQYKVLQNLLVNTPTKKITDKLYKLNPLVRDCVDKGRNLVKTKINPCRNQLDKLDETIEKLTKEKKSLRLTIDEKAAQEEPKLQRQLWDYREQQDDLNREENITKYELQNLKKTLIEYERKVSKIQKGDKRTKKLRKKVDILEKAIKSIDNVYNSYRLSLKVELEEKINSLFYNLFTAKKYFQGFKIYDDFNYDLLNKNGQSWKTGLSNAQRKLFALSFVVGLRLCADEEAPFFFDSPVGVVDPEHRKNYANVIPKSSSQLILLITGSEKTKFIEYMKHEIGMEWNINYDDYNNISSFKMVTNG